METGSDREVGIAFKDGALFSARVALNKFDCDPNNTGKVLFSLTRGAFTFIGKVAKTGSPKIGRRKDSRRSARWRVRHPDTCRISPPAFGGTPSRDLG